MKNVLVALYLGCLLIWTAMHVARATEGSVFDNSGGNYFPAADEGRWAKFLDEGIACAEERRFDTAIRFYSAALNMRPPDEAVARLHYWRGKAYLGKGDRAQGAAEFELALRFPPTEANHYSLRGAVFERQGNYRAASADYAKALQLAPDTPSFQNDLAWMKATAPTNGVRNASTALRLATSACELSHWRNSDFLDTIAAAFAESGNFEQAIRYQEQAIKRSPPNGRKEMENRLATYRQRKPYRDPVGLH